MQHTILYKIYFYEIVQVQQNSIDICFLTTFSFRLFKYEKNMLVLDIDNTGIVSNCTTNTEACFAWKELDGHYWQTPGSNCWSQVVQCRRKCR